MSRQESTGVNEPWKDKFQLWKEEQMTQGSILTDSKIKTDLAEAGTTSVIACIQN
jgi:hypothetical protein